MPRKCICICCAPPVRSIITSAIPSGNANTAVQGALPSTSTSPSSTAPSTTSTQGSLPAGVQTTSITLNGQPVTVNSSFPVGSTAYMMQAVYQNPTVFMDSAAQSQYSQLQQQAAAWDARWPNGGPQGASNPYDQQIQILINQSVPQQYANIAQETSDAIANGQMTIDSNGNYKSVNQSGCFMSQIIPALTLGVATGGLGGEIAGGLTSMGLGTTASTIAGNAIAGGTISGLTGGCPLKGAAVAGIGAGGNVLLSPTLTQLSNSVADMTGSTLAGQTVAQGLGKAGTSALVAGLTGGNVGEAAIRGGVSGGLTPIATDVASDINPTGSTALTNVIGSTLGTAAGYGLTGGNIAQGAEQGVISSLGSNAKGLIQGINSPNSSTPTQSSASSSTQPASGLDALYSQDINQTCIPCIEVTSTRLPNISPDATDVTVPQGTSGNQSSGALPSDNSDIPDVVVTSTSLPNVTPVSGNTSSSPLNTVNPTTGVNQTSTDGTEVVVTGQRTADGMDVTPTLPPLDPSSLQSPAPKSVTTPAKTNVNVGTASPTSSLASSLGSGSSSSSSGSGASGLAALTPLIATYGTTGNKQIDESLVQIGNMASNQDTTNKPSTDQVLKDLEMGKNISDLEYNANSDDSALGFASGGSSTTTTGLGNNLFQCINAFKCTGPTWSKSLKPYTITVGGNPHGVQLSPLHQICSGSALGHAKGGLPRHYHDAAPKGHHPEFITGLTGYYACGGGTGQSDDIPAMLHDGDYVMDAETVSALGDGSSKAGREVLDGFMHKIPHDNKIKSNPVPAKIADGEYVFPAGFVTALGKGDNKAGAKILDGLREKLREHKRAAPINKIPPKAKSPLDYIRKAK